MVNLLPTLLEEFYEKLEEVKRGTARRAAFYNAPNLVKVAIGMRRAGKTYFTLQKVLELLQNNVPLESILYINFEDDRLLPMDHKAMGKLIDDFFTLFPENHTRLCYLFLDEVQNIADWALVIRRFFDSKKVQIYLTGSSAKLLSKEIATSLRGRSIETEIWPFSFQEFLETHKQPLPKKPFGKKTFDELRKQFLSYLQIGGFPAVQFLSAPERLETLQGYVETVILRDIIERHNVTNVALLRYLIASLIKNAAAPFSIHKFYNDCKSQGFKVGKDTLYTYVQYIEDAYLLFAVPHFSESAREIQTNPKKIYVIDSGLFRANTFIAADSYGKEFENLIYLDLRRQGKNVYYYKTKNGHEVDFVITSKQESPRLLQVAWDLDDKETRFREERALQEAQQELGIKGEILDLQTYLSSCGEKIG
ncbi:MAG: ATP-binding protein [Verrucomicrobia bacterium]|nr:ATP-binding protein [Verrucomicrobiota bacterium]